VLARRFFYVSAALLMLALTYHLGAARADAQAPANPIAGVSGVGNFAVVVCANGDAFYSGDYGATWYRTGNVFSNLPTGTTPSTVGRVKALYRR